MYYALIPMEVTPFLAVAAALPLLVILFTMVQLRWNGTQAGIAGWVVAMVLAPTLFQADISLIWYAHIRSLLLSLYVLYIVWGALLLYQVVNEAKAVQDISLGVARLTSDSLIQLLLLAWLFSSFLQGVTGFGVPVAVIAPLLIGMGFEPMLALVATSISHAWAVTFGSAGTSFLTLVAVTGVPGAEMAAENAIILGVAALVCGWSVAHIHSGWRGVARSTFFILIVGTVVALTQYGLAMAGFFSVAAFGAALAGLIVAVPMARLPLYRGVNAVIPPTDPALPRLRTRLPFSIAAYAMFLVVIPAAEGIPALHALLNQVILDGNFPDVMTGLGWVVPAGGGRSVSVFGHTGALIIYVSMISFAMFALRGRYTDVAGGINGAAKRVLHRTFKASQATTLSILFLSAMGVVMDNSGMVYSLAVGLQGLLPSAFYPMMAPLIGALGAFVTGSNTNSNVLFGPLQQQVAVLTNLAVPAILAAQSAGASVGSIIAPAKLVVGATTANLSGSEGETLRRLAPYVIVLLLVMGGMTYLLL
jgi:lactate permease